VKSYIKTNLLVELQLAAGFLSLLPVFKGLIPNTKLNDRIWGFRNFGNGLLLSNVEFLLHC